MDTKDAYIRQLENPISAMQKQIDNLTELILIMRQDKFGVSSEKTPKDAVDGQLSLFDGSKSVLMHLCRNLSQSKPGDISVKIPGQNVQNGSKTFRYALFHAAYPKKTKSVSSVAAP